MNDAGVRLPSHIISGLKVLVPASAGKYVYVSALTVTPNIVTLVLVATDALGSSSATPLLTLSLVKPIARHQQYELESQYPGAGGWITFGGGIEDAAGYQGRFTLPTQTFLSPRAATWYKDPPVSSAAKLNSPALTGLVHLASGSNMEVVKECREVPNYAVPSYSTQYCGTDELGTQVRDVIVFRLVGNPSTPDENVFEDFRGPCGDRPESRTCGDPEPIEFLGPVSPDCCGNITLEMRGCSEISAISAEVTVDDLGDPVSSDDACGVILDCSLGLADACLTKDRLPDATGKLPNEYDDLCVSISYVSESDGETIPPDPVFVFDASAAFDSVDVNLPLTDNFESFGEYVIRNGEFKYKGLSGDTLMVANSSAMRNVVTYEPAVAINNMWFKRGIATVVLQTGPSGGLHNAAVIANYRETEVNSGLYSYYAAEIDWDGHYRGFKLFRIAKFTGTSWVNIFSLAVPELKLDNTYQITLEVYPQPNQVDAWLRASLLGITDPSIDITIGPLAVNSFGPADGLAGLATNRAVSRYLDFELQNITAAP